MAIFLLIYIIVCLVWFFWAGILTYLLLRYRYPDRQSTIGLAVFWVFSVLVLIISAIFIAKGDWVSVPSFFVGLTTV